MKKTMFFLMLAWPMLSFAQQKIAFEFSAAPNYTFYTKPINSSDASLSYDFGIGLSSKLENEDWALVGGLRFASFSTTATVGELRWGTQHNGMGGFNPSLPSLEPVTAVDFKSNYFYLEMPLGIRLQKGSGKLQFVGQATAGPSMFLSSRTIADYDYADGTSAELTQSGNVGSFRRINAMASLSAGIQFSLSPKIKMQLMPHGDLQLFSIAKNSQTGARFYSMGLRIGASYLL